MFRIKICGITNPRDAELVVAFGADAIGLNFYKPSPRSVTIEQARKIVSVVKDKQINVPWAEHDKLTIAGVFVNASPAEIDDTVDAVGLDTVQLHGDESTAQLANIQSRPLIRALRLQSLDDPKVDQIQSEAAMGQIEMVLVDAYSPDEYGGSGKTAAWDLVPSLSKKWPSCKTVVAGGLSPDNVAEALRISQAFGVDVASGVEEQPGLKSESRLRKFIQGATTAIQTQGD